MLFLAILNIGGQSEERMGKVLAREKSKGQYKQTKDDGYIE